MVSHTLVGLQRIKDNYLFLKVNLELVILDVSFYLYMKMFKKTRLGTLKMNALIFEGICDN